ncbi:MAG TPA: hypothetical protein VGP68_06040 [Gemmataceae bacterium]|jgi:multiple sugar transport system substrate-binding protein|nr:hypothetical protein [Gemmataceae bacterium]
MEKPVVSVSCPPGPAAEILQRFAPSFQASNGITVKIKTRAPETVPDPGTDLWVVEPALMPSMAASGKLRAVPENLTAPNGDYSWHTILPVYRSKLLIWDQESFALPLADEAMLCFYRTDLLSDPKNRTDFKAKYGRELTAPATWQDIERIAEFFQGKLRPGLDRACSSLTALPKDDDGLDRLYYLIAAPFVRQAMNEYKVTKTSPRELFSFHYDVDTGKPLLHTAGFVAALDMLCRLQPYRAGAGSDPYQSFADGEAVICFAPVPAIARFQKSATTKNRFAVARPPGSEIVYGFDQGKPAASVGINEVPYLGATGAVMVVPESSQNARDAFGLAAYLSNPKTSRDIVTDPAWGGGVFRSEHLAVGMGWGSFGLGAGQTEDLIKILRETYVHTQISNPLLRLRIPDQASHRAVVLRELRAALFSEKKPAEAMQDADKAWLRLDAKMTPAERLATYRLSVNLR